MNRPQTRVFLVDDHPLVREWLANLIENQPDMVVCGEAESAGQALATIGDAQPDVAILDVSLDGRSGIELIKDLRLSHPQVLILVLSMHDEELYAPRALRAGARGYIMKREVTQKVILAIRRIQEGKTYVSDRMASILAEKVATQPASNPAVSPISLLSDRELEVFALLGRGRATRHIAETLHVSAKTVQAYCARIKEKLGVATSTELLREAIRWAEDESAR
jgi:DNA-binding NarL/FixJ family response regulator